MVQVLCSRLRIASESSTTPVGIAWMCVCVGGGGGGQLSII